MANELFLPLMPDVPMFVDGIMDMQWQEFFRSLFYRVGGSGPVASLGESELSLITNIYNVNKSYDSQVRDLEDSILMPITVADIDDPIELANYRGNIPGSLIAVCEVAAATNEYTIYAWDSVDAGGANSPYVMAGSAGFWIAICGKYRDGVSILGDNVTIGKGAAATDYTLTFDGESNDGVITWMEDEDYFLFSDDIFMSNGGQIFFRNSNNYIYSGGVDLISIVSVDLQLYSNAIDLGRNGVDADTVLQFMSNTNDGVITWKNTEDYFRFGDAINVGVDDAGHDVKFFGATSGKYFLWDESTDSLRVEGNIGINIAPEDTTDLTIGGTTTATHTGIGVRQTHTPLVGATSYYGFNFVSAPSGATAINVFTMINLSPVGVYAGTITALNLLQATPVLIGGTYSTFNGLDISPIMVGATIGVYNGINIGNIPTATTGHAIKTGTGKVYFGDDTEIVGSLKTQAGRIIPLTRIDHTDSPYTVLSTDHIIVCDTDGGAIEIDLPAGVNGTQYIPKNVGSSGNDVTIDPNGGELIDGDATVTLIDKESVTLVFETTEEWIVI